MTTASVPRRSGVIGIRGLKLGIGWLVLAALLILWQVAATVSATSSTTTFTRALESMIGYLTGPSLVEDVLPSIVRVIVGFAIAGVLGVVVGLILGSLRRLDAWVHPLISFMRSIPPALIVPVALLVLGLGPQLVISVIVFGAFWPVLLNTFDGARRIDPMYLEVARAARTPYGVRLSRVILPACLPTIMAGLRTALSISLILMVVSEVLASSEGLGYRMNFAQQTFNVSGTYGAVLLLALLGWIFDTIFVAVERRVLRWHPAFQGGNLA